MSTHKAASLFDVVSTFHPFDSPGSPCNSSSCGQCSTYKPISMWSMESPTTQPWWFYKKAGGPHIDKFVAKLKFQSYVLVSFRSYQPDLKAVGLRHSVGGDLAYYSRPF